MSGVTPASWHICASCMPGSDIPGVPASETTAKDMPDLERCARQPGGKKEKCQGNGDMRRNVRAPSAWQDKNGGSLVQI
jgi:hypothetical protein